MSRSRIIRDSNGGTVIFGDGGPIILSGGVPHVLAMSSEGGKAAIRLVDPNGQATAVLDGSVPDVSEAYAAMCSDLKRPLRRDWRNFSLGVAAGAVMAAAILGAVSASIVAGAWRATSTNAASASPPLLPSAAQGLPGVLEDTPGLIPALEELQKRADAERAASPKPAPAMPQAVAEAPSAPVPEAAKPLPAPIVDRPDFLNVPTAAGSVPASSPEPFAPLGAAADGLPPYVAPTASAAAPAAVGRSLDEAVSHPAQNSGADSSVNALPMPMPTPPVTEAPRADGPVPAATGNAAAEPISAAPTPGGEGSKPSAAPEKTSAAEAARKKALAAAKSMVANGLTPDKAADVLSQLETLGNTDADKITPAMLSTLPHEVAQMLLDNGLAGGDSAPDGVQYSIIRVPESVIDKHRGPDGIADIPERNTWAATGNYVSIPLPGGGDVKSPEDLKAFHLQP